MSQILYAGFFPTKSGQVCLPDDFCALINLNEQKKPLTILCIGSELPGSSLGVCQRAFRKSSITWSDGRIWRPKWTCSQALGEEIRLRSIFSHIDCHAICGTNVPLPAALADILESFKTVPKPLEILMLHPGEDNLENYRFGMTVFQSASHLQTDLAIVCLDSLGADDLPEGAEWPSNLLEGYSRLEARKLQQRCYQAISRFDAAALYDEDHFLLQKLGISGIDSFFIMAGILDAYAAKIYPDKTNESGGLLAMIQQPVIYSILYPSNYGSRFDRIFCKEESKKQNSQNKEIHTLAKAVLKTFAKTGRFLDAESMKEYAVKDISSGSFLHVEILANGEVLSQKWGKRKDSSENIRQWIRSQVILACMDIPRYADVLSACTTISINTDVLSAAQAKRLMPSVYGKGIEV